ncbi:unnamed protein product, partial [marine sediment metagenome]
IRAELRSIVRRREALRRPVEMFQPLENMPTNRPCYRVVFDNNPPKNITGLKYKAQITALPDERIQDEILSLAQGVWHLKDRLKQWTRVQNLNINIEDLAKKSISLMVCADLANIKKHGGTDDRSGLFPRLSEVYFDTSKSGLLEIYYAGGMKEKELRLSKPNPISFTVKILTKDEKGDDEKVLAENAIDYIWEAFEYWLPIIQRLSILKDNDGESRDLIRLLYS